MASAEELFLDYLDANSGADGEYCRLSEEGIHPPVYTVTYQDTPEAGMMTAFTVGLSSFDYPEWTYARPELVICVNSADIKWGLAIGDVAAKSRGKHGFCIGTTVNFNAQISEESEMSAFWLFYPSMMSREQATVKLPDRTIFITQMYTIYEGEARRIREKGFEWLVKQDIDFYDVQRKDMSK